MVEGTVKVQEEAGYGGIKKGGSRSFRQDFGEFQGAYIVAFMGAEQVLPVVEQAGKTRGYVIAAVFAGHDRREVFIQ